MTTRDPNGLSQRGAKTKYRGVRIAVNGSFEAFIGINGRRINLGLFRRLEAAVDARRKGEKIYWRGTKFDPNWRAFTVQRYSAKARGIPFLLTFEEWLRIWEASGHLNERGQHKGQYCMARYGDQGSYVIGNVKIILTADNTREACLSKPRPDIRGQKNGNCRERQIERRGTTKLPRKHRNAISKGLKGHSISAETRDKIRQSNLGKKRSAETRNNVSKAKKGIPWSPARRIAQEKRGLKF